jgi:hypothetical protein
VVEPVLRGDIAAGRKVRLLYLFGAGADDVDGDAVKADTGFRARHATDFDRVAVVSDESWVKPGAASVVVLDAGRRAGVRGPRSVRGQDVAGRRRPDAVVTGSHGDFRPYAAAIGLRMDSHAIEAAYVASRPGLVADGRPGPRSTSLGEPRHRFDPRQMR